MGGKISEDLPKSFRRPDEHSRTFSENFRRLSKTFKKDLKMFRWYTNQSFLGVGNLVIFHLTFLSGGREFDSNLLENVKIPPYAPSPPAGLTLIGALREGWRGKCSEIWATIKVLYNPRVNKVFTFTCHVMSCHAMLRHVMSCHVMPYHVCHVVSCHVMS